jgi:hypothetical protein
MSSFIEKEIVKSNSPLNFNTIDEIFVNGEHGFWLNKNEEVLLIFFYILKTFIQMIFFS